MPITWKTWTNSFFFFLDKFFKKYNLQRLNQEEVEIMNRLITSTKIKIVTKNLPRNKSPGLEGFTNSIKLY